MREKLDNLETNLDNLWEFCVLTNSPDTQSPMHLGHSHWQARQARKQGRGRAEAGQGQGRAEQAADYPGGQAGWQAAGQGRAGQGKSKADGAEQGGDDNL